MKVNWFAVIIVALVLIAGLSAWPDARTFLHQQLGQASPTSGYGQAKIKFSEVTVQADVPLSSELQAKGLGGRTGLGDNEGMAWIYDQAGEYQFWMKDMLIPLDFVWIDQGQIVDLTANVAPPAPGQGTLGLNIYQPKQPVSVVLEVKAGFIAQHHLSIGDPVEVDRL